MEKTKILVVEANPRDTQHLKLNRESAIIETTFEEAKVEELFELKKISAATATDLYDKLWHFKPNIVHFCGHGEKNHLLFVDDISGETHRVDAELLVELFAQFADSIQCAIFNACESEDIAAGMVQHIEYAIGMNEPIWDDTSLNFTTGFYRGLFRKQPIDKAFQNGLMAVKLANLNQQKTVPVLKQKQTLHSDIFMPNLQTIVTTSPPQYDLLIHAASSEKAWAETFASELQTYLAAKFGKIDACQLHLHCGELPINQASSYLLVLSPDYLQQYPNAIAALHQHINQKSLFLVEYSPTMVQPPLSGLFNYCFWQQLKQGVYHHHPNDPLYGLNLRDLAEDIYNYLIQLKRGQLFQQQLQQTANAQLLTSLVFVDVAPEDRQLADQVKQLLLEYGIGYTMPSTLMLDPSAMRQDLESNLLNCDAVLMIYGQSSPFWVREHLLTCHRLQRKREEPLKIIALHQQIESPTLDLQLPNLQVFYCPPENVQSYLPRFVEALK